MGPGGKITLPINNADEWQALQDLVNKCVPATFGRNGKDVYDESYRRAGALDTTGFMTDFCPYEHGIIDIVTQLLLPPITGEVKAIVPVPVQISREEHCQRRKKIYDVVRRFVLRRREGMGLVVHAENVAKCMEQLEVPVMTGEALDIELQNMLIMSAMPEYCAMDQPFPDYMPMMEVCRIAAQRVDAKKQAEHDRLEFVRQEHNMQKRLRQRGIRAELYKLNVYSGPSGMFKAHVDTPRSGDQVGSLVVALPVAFEGGALAVRQQGQEVLHDWSTSINGDCPSIQWAAFYSDCEHEVLEVTSGHRLTLTYNLFLSAGTGLLNDAALSLIPERLPVYGQLHGLLERPCFLAGGGYLGVHLAHSYPHANDTLHRFVPNMLKGTDMATYRAFAALGLACVLTSTHPVTGAEALRTLDNLHRSNSAQHATGTIGSRPLASLLSSMEITPEYDENDNDSDEVGTEDNFEGEDSNPDDHRQQYDSAGRMLGERGLEIREGKQAWRKVSWLNAAQHQELSRVYMAYGNQAEMKVSYSSVALVVKIPSWKERRGAGTTVAESIENE